MDSIGTLFLVEFFSKIDIFLVIFIRIIAFFIVLPVVSGRNIPTTGKIILSVSIAYLLFKSEIVTSVNYHDTVVGYFMLLIKEFFIGFTMGFVVFLIFNIMYFAGQLIDYQIGFSMVNVFDPISQIQVPIVGNMLYLIASVLFIQTGGFHTFIFAMANSFTEIPIGSAMIVENQQLLLYIVGLLVDFFVISFKLALPIVGSILIIDVALGILVKAVPQMNVFVVGMPLKVLAGFILLYFLIPSIVEFFDVIYEAASKTIVNVIGGFAP